MAPPKSLQSPACSCRQEPLFALCPPHSTFSLLLALSTWPCHFTAPPLCTQGPISLCPPYISSLVSYFILSSPSEKLLCYAFNPPPHSGHLSHLHVLPPQVLHPSLARSTNPSRLRQKPLQPPLHKKHPQDIAASPSRPTRLQRPHVGGEKTQPGK